MPDDDFAWLVIGMFFILENASQWISEDGKRFFESNPVTGYICFGLLRIPLKLKIHPAEILA